VLCGDLRKKKTYSYGEAVKGVWRICAKPRQTITNHEGKKERRVRKKGKRKENQPSAKS